MSIANLRIHASEIELIKAGFGFIIQAMDDGACFFTTDLDKFTYVVNHIFNIPGVEVGEPYNPEGIVAIILKSQEVAALHLKRNIYGMRISSYGGPIWSDDETEVVGTWVMAIPRQHKLVNAFDSFAPVITELLPEGGMLYVADKEKFVKKEGSKKFDVEQIQVDQQLSNDSVGKEAMEQKKLVMRECSAEVYGVPTLIAASPIFADEEVVGTFGLVLPRQMANQLKEISYSLEQGLNGVSASVEQITSATNDISNNQRGLHEEIEKVKGQLGDINEVMAFIKNIADETKMLGLNAAIEAARVGEAGLGFGVVAEEIRKLSQESKQTVAQIRNLTKSIEKSMNETAGSSESTLAVVEETSAAIQEVNATIEEMTVLANSLTAAAESL
jgi:hypothetical protein